MTKRLSLERILQTQGFGTRRDCRHLILAGEVSVADTVEDNPDAVFAPDGLEFSIDGTHWRYRERVHVVLNKPADYECSRKPSHHPGVLTLFPEQFLRRDVQPVGRLDHDTTGLLLLSDDGAFIHAQSHPKRHVAKTYVATTAEPVTDKLVARLQAGVKLIDEPEPLAARARQLDSHRLEVILDQGKYHQVKRMLAAAGNHCAALCRTAIGGLTLDSLALEPGEWRYLEAEDLALLGPFQT